MIEVERDDIDAVGVAVGDIDIDIDAVAIEDEIDSVDVTVAATRRVSEADVELIGCGHLRPRAGRETSRVDDVVLLEIEQAATECC